VVIPFMDRATIYNRTLWQKVTALADNKQIPWQLKTVIAGGTDASAIQRSGIGVPVVTLAAPLRNIHSAYAIARITDLDHLCTLTSAIVENLGEIVS